MIQAGARPYARLRKLTLFRAEHRELEAAGQLDHPFTERELGELRKIRVLKHWRSDRLVQIAGGKP